MILVCWCLLPMQTNTIPKAASLNHMCIMCPMFVCVWMGCPHMYCMPECVYASSFWLLHLSASQTGFSWCVGNPFDWEHFQLLKQGRSGQINTLSFILMAQRRGHNSRSRVQKDCMWVCMCVFTSVTDIWITLHISCLSTFVAEMGAGLVEGTKMRFSHVCTSKRTVQIPEPRGRPQIPKLQHLETYISATLRDTQEQNCTVLLPSIFEFTQREVCWLIYLRNCLRDLKKQKQ